MAFGIVLVVVIWITTSAIYNKYLSPEAAKRREDDAKERIAARRRRRERVEDGGDR